MEHFNEQQFNFLFTWWAPHSEPPLSPSLPLTPSVPIPPTDLLILPLPLHLAGSLVRNHRHIWHTYFFYKFSLSFSCTRTRFLNSQYIMLLSSPHVPPWFVSLHILPIWSCSTFKIIKLIYFLIYIYIKKNKENLII